MQSDAGFLHLVAAGGRISDFPNTGNAWPGSGQKTLTTRTEICDNDLPDVLARHTLHSSYISTVYMLCDSIIDSEESLAMYALVKSTFSVDKSMSKCCKGLNQSILAALAVFASEDNATCALPYANSMGKVNYVGRPTAIWD